jgi:predicted amidohydrolase
MKVFCCQFDLVWENKTANLAKASALLGNGNLPNGSLVLLPEMFLTGFTMNAEAATELPLGATEQALAELARRHRIYLTAGLVCLGADRRSRNQSVTFSPEGREVARYTKIHPFTPGGESANYAAGEQTVTFKWHEMVVAPFICYDLRFPEIFRIAAWQRPHLYTVIASWPEARIGHWTKLLQARAIENQCYVAGCNRVGRDPKFHYPGRSVIVNPHGEILADAEDREGIIGAELNLSGLDEYRQKIPFLDDMRASEIRRAV